jgi:MFS family permease
VSRTLIQAKANASALSTAVLIAAGIVSGLSAGLMTGTATATLTELAPPERRGQVISAYFAACYCGLIIPVVGVGIASGSIGDFPAVLALSILLATLCVFPSARIKRAL